MEGLSSGGATPSPYRLELQARNNDNNQKKFTAIHTRSCCMRASYAATAKLLHLPSPRDHFLHPYISDPLLQSQPTGVEVGHQRSPSTNAIACLAPADRATAETDTKSLRRARFEQTGQDGSYGCCDTSTSSASDTRSISTSGDVVQAPDCSTPSHKILSTQQNVLVSVQHADSDRGYELCNWKNQSGARLILHRDRF